MTFKAIAAALILLLLLAGVSHNHATSATSAASVAAHSRGLQLGVTEPTAAHGGLQKATLFSGVMDAAKQAGRHARSHVPEPKVLLLLGLVLLVVGLRRGNKPHRNRPSQ